jgi:hypothetical protein
LLGKLYEEDPEIMFKLASDGLISILCSTKTAGIRDGSSSCGVCAECLLDKTTGLFLVNGLPLSRIFKIEGQVFIIW